MKTCGILFGLMLCAGCAIYRIPTPCGDAVIKTFCKNVELPKTTISISNAVSNVIFTIEGYASQGDTQTITASTDALGAMIGSAAKSAVK